MNPSVQFKTTTLPFLIAFAFACFGLSPTGRAVVPAPDGGYPSFNTAEGEDALFSLTTGVANTANGAFALYKNRTGNGNTALGFDTLFSNTTGFQNTATGAQALLNNTIGARNTANGLSALRSNIRGANNTAAGYQALFNNTIGTSNTATGMNALRENIEGFHNTATGFSALAGNTTGAGNIATGVQALLNNTTGRDNTANGGNALAKNTTGNENIAVGVLAGFNLTTGDNNIDIGNEGVAGESNKIRIGTKGTHDGTFVAGISGVAVTGSQVVVNANGKLGVAASSARFKEAIKPMDKASEAIHALKPVTFHYKQELDPDCMPQFGLVAEEVAKVNPDLVARDADGKVYTVRYEAVNAMLLNEFLKEHHKNEEQEATIAQQQKQIDALTAGLQRMSAQLETSRPAPQMVNNNH
jgi:hypothetical protein